MTHPLTRQMSPATRCSLFSFFSIMLSENESRRDFFFFLRSTNTRTLEFHRQCLFSDHSALEKRKNRPRNNYCSLVVVQYCRIEAKDLKHRNCVSLLLYGRTISLWSLHFTQRGLEIRRGSYSSVRADTVMRLGSGYKSLLPPVSAAAQVRMAANNHLP